MYWKAVMASDAARSLPVCEPTICSGNLLSPAINLIIEKLIKKGGSSFPLILSVCVCLHTAAFPFLSACLLYSRLVLNLQKFIRYKLLLPSYHFIAAHRIESPFSLLSCSSLPSYCFFYDSRRRLLPTIQCCIPHHLHTQRRFFPPLSDPWCVLRFLLLS